ncbi:MAG: hypothetical protein HY904_08170 [Deltaproteobacteria bacterium]|nr:hypothetical protein [Deltaproteobacteria bacterium]
MLRRLGVVAAVAWLSGGCLILNTGGTSQGSVRVTWLFPEGRTCADVNATQMQLTLSARSSGGSSLGPTLVACNAGSFVINHVREGDYVLQLDSVNPENVIEYSATANVLVTGSHETDLGQVTLTALLGELIVDWQFERVNPAAPTQDCTLAGVSHVQVVVTDSGGTEVYSAVPECESGPAGARNLEAGRYYVSLYALYYLSMVPFIIYQARDIPVDVTLQQTADLGLQTLTQVTDNFGNLNVSWSFSGGGTCTSTGVSQLTVNIYRGAGTTVEDTFTAACNASPTVRHTFVPGDWRVEISGTGTGGAYHGTSTVNVAPGQTANAPVTLAL